MLRPSFSPPSFSPRRVLGFALALLVGAGIGLGAAALWAGPQAGATPVPRAQAAQVAEPASTTATEPTRPEEKAESAPPAPPAPPEAPAAPRLTLDEAKAVALKVAPGRVVEIDEDSEPTGLRYDVTILHDNRTSTDVEVDATSGEVTSIEHDDDWD